MVSGSPGTVYVQESRDKRVLDGLEGRPSAGLFPGKRMWGRVDLEGGRAPRDVETEAERHLREASEVQAPGHHLDYSRVLQGVTALCSRG